MQGAIPGIFHFLMEIIMNSPPTSLKSNQGHVLLAGSLGYENL